jgi:PAS domain S-box-containing protein
MGGSREAGSGGRGVDEELHRQRERFAPVLEISPSPIVITDLDANIVAWSPAAVRLFGYTAEEAVGRNIDDLVAATEDLHGDAVAVTERASSGKDNIQTITRRTRKDGTLIDVELLAAPLVVEGEAVGTLGIYHDITELNRQRRFFEALLEVSPEAIVTANMDDTVRSWNPAAERLFGYSAEEAIGQDLDGLVARRDDLMAEARALDRLADHTVAVRRMAQRTRKDGSLVDVDIVGGPVTVGGELVGKHVFYHDITELQQQKRYFQSLLEISPAAIVVTDLEARVVSWNPGAERLFGYQSDEAVGRPLDDLVATRVELHDEAVGYSRRAATGERIEFIGRRTRKDGSLVDVQGVSEPVVVAEERIGFVAIYHDITELQRQKRYYESLVQYSPVAIALLDMDGGVTSWNPAAERLFGYSSAEAVGRNIDELVAASDDIRADAEGYTERGLRGDLAHAITHRTRKDGSFVDVEMFAAPVTVAGETVGFYALYHDISELQRQKRYYEALFESSPVAVALVNAEGNVTAWNPTAEELFGYTAEEAIGRNIDDLVANSDELREEALAVTDQGMRGELAHLITRRTRKDGTLVDVETFGAPVVVGGEHVGLYGMWHDIRELQQARRDAEAATEAKSAFLATMSHEIRTPLNAVIGMTGLLLDTELSAEQRNFAEVIRGSGDALLGVINDILDFSKIEAGRLELETAPFDLRECVESALELVAASALKKGLDLAYEIDPEAPGALVGDLTRLRQVLINLLNNAVKFTEHGEVVVTVVADPAGSEGRQRLEFAVRDTGIGIPEDRMDRLFESFSQVDRSTTRRYGGTGLGLAISRRLVELMDGTMWAESTAGQGSTFRFTIEAPAAPAPVRPYERAGAPQLVGRRVLIVDDNDTNRQILARQTQSWKMLAWETGSPAVALEWIRRGDPFDVAILDMQMPDMDGITLAREIRRQRDARTLPLVMLTSLGSSGPTPEEFAAYLTKPIKPSQLYEALMDVFGERGEVAERPPEAAPADELPSERAPLRILVVEDHAVNQQLALLLLQKLGYRADVAGNGAEALEALERQPYDVVLMDVEMPEMDGLEATRRIHARWRDERPHIVAVTANAMQGERELCLQAGMDDYITKPIRMEELTASLDRGSRSRRRPAGGAAPAVDRAATDRLVATLGDGGEALVGALIETFMAGVGGLSAGLRAAVGAHDADEVRRIAHTLKGDAVSFGAAGLADLCRALEARAKEGALEDAPERLSGIEAELERVTAELRQIGEDLRR